MKGFYSRKIHSLLGVIPLGAFFIEHMMTNFAAVEGGASGFTDSVLWLNSLPLVFFPIVRYMASSAVPWGIRTLYCVSIQAELEPFQH